MTHTSRWRKGRVRVGSIYTKEVLDKAELHCAYDKHEWFRMGIHIGGTELYGCSCGMVSLGRTKWGEREPFSIEPLWGIANDPANLSRASMEMRKMYWAYKTVIRLTPFAGEFGNVFPEVIKAARINSKMFLHVQ